jgi:hypothetical protein
MLWNVGLASSIPALLSVTGAKRVGPWNSDVLLVREVRFRDICDRVCACGFALLD